MAREIRWGILGTGAIARQFAEDLAIAEGARLLAVASRTQAGADRFGQTHGVERRYAGYEALAADPDVEAVYIATPNSLHMDNTLLCLEHGKAVLCEKPFAVNTAQAERMIAFAAEKRLFLMEAMWTLFSPAILRAKAMVDQGAIGEPRMITADFCFRIEISPGEIIFQPALAGGSLMDVGIYPIMFAQFFFGGPPVHMAAHAHIGESAVDEQAVISAAYPGGRLAALSSAVRTQLEERAVIAGTEGRIEIPRFFQPSRIEVHRDGKVEDIAIPHRGLGYVYEAEAVMGCLRAGLLECPGMPHAWTLDGMRTLDAARAQIGLRFPME